MKRRTLIVIALIIIVVLAAVGALFVLNLNKNVTTSSSSTEARGIATIPNEDGTCQTKQLEAIIKPETAAGNVYATLEMTNTSKVPCEITLGNSITTKFGATNIKVQFKEKDIPTKFMLAPSAKVYSQVHYPNGPQCSSEVKEDQIIFFYQLAMPFDTKDGSLMKVQACTSSTEETIIDIWPLSKTPITPK